MSIYEGTGVIGYTTMAFSNVVRYRTLTFGAALPFSFGAASSYTGQSFNYYLVVQ